MNFYNLWNISCCYRIGRYVKFKITYNPNIHVHFNSGWYEFEKGNRG